eukprot:TRINITY_DN9364_c0_g1_i1.p1 TRINITY_DN9364_c0_g1~~TRINITY_DN9364_c0_g1_i1.p1  ORF type:complete len:111 (+),score=20.25 TRINITY_DN9364_c0_g1_i1:45-377(+)
MAARIIVNILISAGSVLGKALAESYVNALQNSGRAAARKMTLEEAEAILGVSRKNGTRHEMLEKYQRHFEANDPEKGGSFYLQSKVYRAKEAWENAAGTGTAPPPPPPPP